MTQDTEALKAVYEARICPGVPTDCCDYGVISHATGKEVCRVWLEEDARRIADLLNTPDAGEVQAVSGRDLIESSGRLVIKALKAARVPADYDWNDPITSHWIAIKSGAIGVELAAAKLSDRAAELRTPAGRAAAEWHESDAEMVSGELDRLAAAIRKLGE